MSDGARVRGLDGSLIRYSSSSSVGHAPGSFQADARFRATTASGTRRSSRSDTVDLLATVSAARRRRFWKRWGLAPSAAGCGVDEQRCQSGRIWHPFLARTSWPVEFAGVGSLADELDLKCATPWSTSSSMLPRRRCRDVALSVKTRGRRNWHRGSSRVEEGVFVLNGSVEGGGRCRRGPRGMNGPRQAWTA